MIHDSPDVWQGAEFRRSSFSGANGGNCVEIAHAGAAFGIRDSKVAGGPVLMLGEAPGRSFLAAVRRHR